MLKHTRPCGRTSETLCEVKKVGHKRQRNLWFRLYEISRTGEQVHPKIGEIKTERLGRGEGGTDSDCSAAVAFPLVGDKKCGTRQEWWLWTYQMPPNRRLKKKKRFIYLFLERGKGREKERERNINVWLPLTWPLLGTWPATQACALTGNWTGDSLVCRPALNPLGHTSQGLDCIFLLGKTNYKKVNERMKR